MKAPNWLFLFFLFWSCSDQSSSDRTEVSGWNVIQPIEMNQNPVRWILTQMTGNIEHMPPLTGDNLPWQEYYLFSSDGTFMKARTIDESTLKANGKYEVLNSDNQNIVELTYSQSSVIIGNCTGGVIETLVFQSNGSFQSAWQACDGPGLTYEIN